jgi:hypothetical protein
MLALALLPGAAGLTVMKPNVGLALFAWRPAWRTVVVGSALIIGTVAVAPDWIPRWLHLVRTSPTHRAPLFVGVGAVCLLALLRWRRPEARLLAAMTLIPHGLYFYDELPLWLIARSRRDALVLSGASWVSWVVWIITSDGPHLRDVGPWLVLFLYLPCLALVLSRPNEGPMPSWVESSVRRLPKWIRGNAPELAQPPIDPQRS